MVSSSKHRPTNDLHSGSNIQTTNQIRQGKSQPDFNLSTRIINQSNKRDFHGMDLVRPEHRKSAISAASKNPPQMTGTTTGAEKERDIKNGRLIPKYQIISSEKTNRVDALMNQDFADNVRDDKKDSKSTEINFDLQQMAFTVAKNFVNTEASKLSE